jgi:hypothetical protein
LLFRSPVRREHSPQAAKELRPHFLGHSGRTQMDLGPP